MFFMHNLFTNQHLLSEISKIRNPDLYLRFLLSLLPFGSYKKAFRRADKHTKKIFDLSYSEKNSAGRSIRFYGLECVDQYLEDLEIKKTLPGCVVYKDVMYYPSNGRPFTNSGLYDCKGNIIRESCLFRGTHKSEMITKIKPHELSLKKTRLKGTYIYGGPIAEHYGHFLTEGVSRLWYLFEDELFSPFLLFHGSDSALEVDFIKNILKTLPIPKDRIMVSDRAVQLAEVIIPLPSMTNRGEIYNVHGKLPAKVAETILNSGKIKYTDQPLYLSRRKLPLKSRVILNELKLEKELRKYGVKIVHPEELPFSEQIQLFNTHRVIMGPLGSAHHTNLFSLNELTQIYFCHSSSIKNFYMIDNIKKTSSHYIVCCHRPFWDNRRPAVRSLLIDIDSAISALKNIGVI